jgi:acyl-[acyl-carrier-protein] desaturase
MTAASRAADPPAPGDGPPPPDLATVAQAAEAAVRQGENRAWGVADLDWGAIRPELLTGADVSVVRFITFIEDHIPGYVTALLRAFPVDGAEDDLPVVALNREYFRFFIAWAHDEERHASALTRYQETAGLADPRQLRLDLAAEGRKHLTLPYLEPLEIFTYTMLQEKATQLFYQQFRTAVSEPTLRELLLRLGRDEARHFAFYAHLVEEYLRRDPAAAAPHLKEVLRTFRMPLAETLPRYRRWSQEVAATAGYDHRQSYLALERLVDSYTSAAGDSLDEVAALLRAARSLP